ncbi:copper chaperone PCu(A)C [Kitasatospora sp. NBC_00240]|uniref:copper chaperone PCu(A)C n=2 Tax=Kitasatospora sp. NBC_00240 TaxID=2903567 RepID=UPI00225BCFE1|nr:copper chaperone PCu(A)C [Kitasatospora sp. NBC_00240]MCX5211575.1 copper chaperone PCu(A)C [Kitasatospora sp. NBC_00240]
MSSRSFRTTAIAGAVVATVLGAGTILVAWGPDHGAAGGEARLSIADPYIPLPAGGAMAAGYLTVRNAGGEDELVKVSSPGASSVTMHRSTETSMESAGPLAVPAGGALELARGGTHLMIMGWSKQPALGDVIELDLTFARSGTIAVRVPVKPLTYRPGQQDSGN